MALAVPEPAIKAGDFTIRCKHRGLSGLQTTIILLIGLISYHCSYASPHRPPIDQAGLNVITCNIGDLDGKRPSSVHVAKMLARHEPLDVVLLQEVDGRQQARRLARHLNLVHIQYADYNGHRQGLAILSRLPLVAPARLLFPGSGSGKGALAARIRVGRESILICSVHIDRFWPVNVQNGTASVSWGTAWSMVRGNSSHTAKRSAMVRQLMLWLQEHGDGNIILGGDFNTIPPSPAMRLVTETMKDSLQGSGHYYQPTYSKLKFPIQPRIDYLFHTPRIECLQSMVGSGRAGDHFPVRATFKIQ